MDSASSFLEIPPSVVKTLTKFQHKPLPKFPNFDIVITRLINLRPAPLTTDPLICDIHTSDLIESYAALSYSWATEDGDDVPRHEIIIDGMSKLIGSNLFVALRLLRLQNKSRLIWIDALCIDQDNISERNTQVRNMWKIYGHAQEVIAWLGFGQSEVDEAFYRMLICAEHLRANEQHLDDDHLWTAQARETTGTAYGHAFDAFDFENQRTFCDIMRECDENETGERLTQAEARALSRVIYKFLNRRYFKRRWVVQELLHSHGDAVLYWGTHRMPWRNVKENLLDACNRLCRNAWDAMRNEYYLLSHQLGEKGKHMLLIWWGKSLLHILAHCDKFECSDDRDRIYSLALLDKSEDPFQISLDYHKTTREVYIEFSQQLIQKGHQRWLFANREIVPSNPRGEDLDLPSWVFDLRYALDEPPERVRNQDYDIPFSISQDYVLTYFPYYFGTVLKSEHAPRHCWFDLLVPRMPFASACTRHPGEASPSICPFPFGTLTAALKSAQRYSFPVEYNQKDDQIQQDSDNQADDHTQTPDKPLELQTSKSIEKFGPFVVHHLHSGSPIFRGIRPGDLICGSLPDLRDLNNTIHVLKKMNDTSDSTYSLYRTWLVHDDMESDRFLSAEIKATCKMKLRLV